MAGNPGEEETRKGSYVKGRFTITRTEFDVAPMESGPAPVELRAAPSPPSSPRRKVSRSIVQSAPSSPSTPTNSRLGQTSSPSSSPKKDSRFAAARSPPTSPTAAPINVGEARTPSPSRTRPSRLRNESSTVTGSAPSVTPIGATTNVSAPKNPPEIAPSFSASANPFQSSGVQYGYINSGAGSAQPAGFGFGTSTPLFQPSVNTGPAVQPQMAHPAPAFWPSTTPTAPNINVAASIPHWQAGWLRPPDNTTPVLGSTSFASMPPYSYPFQPSGGHMYAGPGSAQPPYSYPFQPSGGFMHAGPGNAQPLYSYPFQPSGGFMNAGPGSAQPPVAGLGTSTTPLFQTFVSTGPTVQPQMAHPAPAFFSTPGPAAATPSSSITSNSGTPNTRQAVVNSESRTKLPSEIKGLTVEEIIKYFNSRLQEDTITFKKQANAIEEWDKRILRNRDVLVKLETGVAEMFERQAKLDQSLELIETHQNEVDEALKSVEEEVENICKDEFASGFLDEAAERRDAMFGVAEDVNRGLDFMDGQIRVVIQNVNANQGGEANAADRSPLDYACQILNNQLIALQSIDEMAEELSSRMKSVNLGDQRFAAGRRPTG